MARHLFGPEVVLVPDVAVPQIKLGPGQAFTVWSADSGGTDYTSDLKTRDGVTALTPQADSNGQQPYFFGPDNVHTVYIDAGSGLRYPSHAVDSVADVLLNSARLTSSNNWTGTQNFAGAVDFDINPTVNGVPVGTGTGGGGGTVGTIASTDITDSSVVGRSVLTAASAAAARTAIGAGTGDGTSNLVIGTTAGTAMAGNTNVGALMAGVTNLVAFLNATGIPYTVYVNSASGLWPNSGARVHASGAAMTGFTGRWIWDSQAYAGALKPAGMIDGDIWDQRVT